MLSRQNSKEFEPLEVRDVKDRDGHTTSKVLELGDSNSSYWRKAFAFRNPYLIQGFL